MRKPRPALPPELDRLELTVRRLLDAHDEWRKRAEAAEARVAELEQAVKNVSAGHIDPVALGEEVQRLEAQNAALRDRLARAHDGVRKILARLQFTAEDR